VVGSGEANERFDREDSGDLLEFLEEECWE
jgi:hypothetical protein